LRNGNEGEVSDLSYKLFNTTDMLNEVRLSGIIFFGRKMHRCRYGKRVRNQNKVVIRMF